MSTAFFCNALAGIKEYTWLKSIVKDLVDSLDRFVRRRMENDHN